MFTGTDTLIGSAFLRMMRSLGGEAHLHRITSPYMAQQGRSISGKEVGSRWSCVPETGVCVTFSVAAAMQSQFPLSVCMTLFQK